MRTVGPSVKIKSDPHCPKCHRKVNGAAEVDGEGAPQPGDLGICAYCCAMLTYDDNLLLRELTAAEFAKLPYQNRRAMHEAIIVAEAVNRQRKMN